MIPVVVLNLARSTSRRAQMAARLDGLGIGYRFFDATDGASLTPDELNRLAPPSALLFDQPLMAAEIGCAATHLAVIREIAAGSSDFVCTMEDDAILSDDVVQFLDRQTLQSLPPFDVLRLVSDPARWKFPAWEIAQSHGRGIYAMSRPGWGLQGQVFSREGARKIASQVGVIRAPIDFVLFHDSHVHGLRVLEVRPGVVEHDTKLINRELMARSVIGDRHEIDRRALSGLGRWRRKYWRLRRKLMAARAFAQVWGFKGMLRIVAGWRPGTYFR